jgi:two-component system KDP operon response regulator KdpE
LFPGTVGAPAQATVLVVVDDRAIREFVGLSLRANGYDVLFAALGDHVAETVLERRLRLVILDAAMPTVSGIEALRQIRSTGSDVPVIVLTARGDDEIRLAAEDLNSAKAIEVGALKLIPAHHAATMHGHEVSLTRTEYALLLTLARSAGRIYSPAELLTRVWGPEYRDQAEILRTHIYRLRQKLEEDPRQPRHLRTRTGLGY